MDDEDENPEERLRKMEAKATAQNVPVLATERPTFAVAQMLAGALK